MRDFNINLLKCNIDKNTPDYGHILYSHAFFPKINSPTWITPYSKTLIDNIFYNNVTKNIISGNITTSISDHLTQFLLISNQNPLSKNQMLNTDEKRSFRNINSMAFEEDLKRVNWNEALTLSEENPNSLFKTFLNIVNRLIDKHCPKKPIPKTKFQTKSKAWIIPALSSSIKIKNRDTNNSTRQVSQWKKEDFMSGSRINRKLTTTLTRVRNKEYYKSFFQDNKKDKKKYENV